ncbi:MAG TPA: thiamine pyrophosphate-dependent enzyme [Terriglobales bacterium]|nr:thiamine pyrophosphate-dependent enzyme [Terriglobales bacterium]
MAALPAFFRGRPARTISDVIVDTLLDWGVDTIFGLPGDGINGVFEALRKRQNEIRFIQTRHEEAAAFMATAHAKYTGRLGVCIATSGPGAIHLLNGLYDAKLDQAPVLAITGQTYSDLKGSSYQQEVNLLQLFSDVAGYNEGIWNAGQAEMVTDLACRHAVSRSNVSHISIPVDVQDFPPTEKPSHMKPARTHTSAARAHWVSVPCEADLRRAAEALDRGKRPVILAGAGALHARQELIELGERLGAPIVKALLGKAAIPDDHPLNAGGLGLIGTAAAEEAMEECDTLLMIGTSFPYMNWLPEKKKDVVGIQIELRPERLGMRYPIDVALAGDSAATLRLLLPMIKRHSDRGFLKKTQKRMREWNELMRVRGTDARRPMRPEVVARTLSELAPRDAVVACDCGTVTTWLARQFMIRGEQKWGMCGTLATMAPGLPYGISAAVAFPKRRAIAFVGDGAFTMLMGEFATAVKYELPLTVVLIKNNTLGQIKWEQMVFLGNPEYQCELHPIDFAAYARACGGAGYTVEDPGQIRAVLQQALRSPKPALVECITDPYEPPMPARATPRQMLHLAESLARGEPNRGRIALTIFRDKVKDLEA